MYNYYWIFSNSVRVESETHWVWSAPECSGVLRSASDHSEALRKNTERRTRALVALFDPSPRRPAPTRARTERERSANAALDSASLTHRSLPRHSLPSLSAPRPLHSWTLLWTPRLGVARVLPTFRPRASATTNASKKSSTNCPTGGGSCCTYCCRHSA